MSNFLPIVITIRGGEVEEVVVPEGAPAIIVSIVDYDYTSDLDEGEEADDIVGGEACYIEQIEPVVNDEFVAEVFSPRPPFDQES